MAGVYKYDYFNIAASRFGEQIQGRYNQVVHNIVQSHALPRYSNVCIRQAPTYPRRYEFS